MEFAQQILQKQLTKIEQVKTIKSLGNGRWQFIAEKNKDIRSHIFNFAVANDLTLLELKQEQFALTHFYVIYHLLHYLGIKVQR